MKIGFIGIGRVGGTIAKKLGKAGHDIFLGAQDLKSPDAQALASEIGSRAVLQSPKDAVKSAELIFLATPWAMTESAVKSIGDFQNKVLVDCTNPLNSTFTELTVGFTTSGGELVQSWAKNARCVKSFNSPGFNIMANPIVEGRKSVMYFCGDDLAAREMTKALIEDVGFEPIDAGPLVNARLLEPFALLWILGANKFGLTRNYAYGILKSDKSQESTRGR